MESLPIIAAFYEQVDVFMLVLVRTLAFFIFLPVISGMSIPMLARLTVAVVISAAIFSSGLITVTVYTPTLPGFVMAVLMEFMAGVMMGFVLYFIFNIILFAGYILDFMMGLSMANAIDPLLQIQMPVTGNIFYMAIMALFIVTGGLGLVMEAFVASYLFLPIGAANILGNQPLAEFFVVQLAGFALIAVQISLPILGAMTVITVALGIMVKASPQMNVFVVGMPIKILIGFVLLATTFVGSLNRIYRLLFERAYHALIDVLDYMVPYSL